MNQDIPQIEAIVAAYFMDIPTDNRLEMPMYYRNHAIRMAHYLFENPNCYKVKVYEWPSQAIILHLI